MSRGTALIGFLACVAVAAAGARAELDANGLRLGASEAQAAKFFPGARCRALEWKSNAADRRCDDARSPMFAGIESRITLYFRADRLEAFDVRFDGKDADGALAQLRSRYGTPEVETTETFTRKGRDDRKVLRVEWRAGEARAVLTVQQDRNRAQLSVWRGAFDEEIYRVR